MSTSSLSSSSYFVGQPPLPRSDHLAQNEGVFSWYAKMYDSIASSDPIVMKIIGLSISVFMYSLFFIYYFSWPVSLIAGGLAYGLGRILEKIFSIIKDYFNWKIYSIDELREQRPSRISEKNLLWTHLFFKPITQTITLDTLQIFAFMKIITFFIPTLQGLLLIQWAVKIIIYEMILKMLFLLVFTILAIKCEILTIPSLDSSTFNTLLDNPQPLRNLPLTFDNNLLIFAFSFFQNPGENFGRYMKIIIYMNHVLQLESQNDARLTNLHARART